MKQTVNPGRVGFGLIFAHFAIFLDFCQGGYQGVFFEDTNFQGDTMTLSMSGGCYNFKRHWIDRISSIQLQEKESCLTIWDYENCRGRSLEVTPTTRGIEELRKLDFDNNVRSVSLCKKDVDLKAITTYGLNPESNPEQRASTKQEIDFYDEPNFQGSIFTLSSSGGCYTFKPKWMKRISSMDSQGKVGCILTWDSVNCEGNSITLTATSEEKANLKLVDFDKKISSIRLCPQEEEDLAPQNKTTTVNNDTSINDYSNMDRLSNADMMRLALEEHNKYRRLHGVPDLEPNDFLQRTAQEYADYLAKYNKFQHSSNMDLGENLGGTSTKNKVAALKETVNLWYKEIVNYDFNHPPHSLGRIKAGHFTALVWKTTTNVGVGMAWNPTRNWWVIVANYDPAGNLKGAYSKNVMPPVARS